MDQNCTYYIKSSILEQESRKDLLDAQIKSLKEFAKSDLIKQGKLKQYNRINLYEQGYKENNVEHPLKMCHYRDRPLLNYLPTP